VTAKSQVEYIVPVLGGVLPAIGQYLASPSGQTVLLLTRVARVVGGSKACAAERNRKVA
jgi:hypothetical protein